MSDARFDKLEKLIQAVQVKTTQTGFSQIIGSKIGEDIVDIMPGLNPQPGLSKQRAGPSPLRQQEFESSNAILDFIQGI